MSNPNETAADGTATILSIVLMIFALVGLALTFLAYQATSLS